MPLPVSWDAPPVELTKASHLRIGPVITRQKPILDLQILLDKGHSKKRWFLFSAQFLQKTKALSPLKPHLSILFLVGTGKLILW